MQREEGAEEEPPPLEAFSRDPAALFCFATEEEAALNAACVMRPCARARQPVTYRGPRLRCAMGQFQAGERVHAATVDWLRGSVRLFASAGDAMNHVPSYCSRGRNALCAVEPEHADVYVREAFAFLLRGHSLFHPECCCEPTVWQQAERAARLGLLPPPPPPPPHRQRLIGRGCPAGSAGAARTLQELASELGVRDGRLLGRVRVSQRMRIMMPLLRVLTELAGLTPVRDARSGAVVALTSPVCCVPQTIACGDDLETAARVLAPRPYVYHHHHSHNTHTGGSSIDAVTRRGVWADLQALARRRRVRVLPADVEGAWAVFWNGDALHLEAEDYNNHNNHNNDNADELHRRRLWAAHAPKPPLLLLLPPSVGGVAAGGGGGRGTATTTAAVSSNNKKRRRKP